MNTEINDNNAEFIGRPITEKAIQLLTQSNQAQFLERFPKLRVFEGQENFNEAAANLLQLGDTPSVDYLDTLIKPGCDLLLWLVKSQHTDKALMLRTELADDKGETKLTHLSFKQLTEDATLNSADTESIGRPIIKTILNALMTSDFDLYCQSLSELSADKLSDNQELFDEAVRVLKPMGNMMSFHYVACVNINDLHTQFWKVRYQKEDENLLFQIMLSDDEDGVKVKGWGFDK